MRRPSVTRRMSDRRGRRVGSATGPVVLKLGGELLEDRARMTQVARVVARAARKTALVVVHGGGKEIDAALAQASIPKQQVDGLRVTDEATLQVVVAVLAGSINTRFVAAINAAGGRAVGLTGADAGVGTVRRAGPHRATTGEFVELGFVGEPIDASEVPLVTALCEAAYVPVIACIGASAEGQLFNVNADTLAGSLASRLRAGRLIVAGATAGVLDTAGQTVQSLDAAAIEDLIMSGTATAGMVAKLRACQQAAEGQVSEVVIADGREPGRLAAVMTGTRSRAGLGTRVMGGPGVPEPPRARPIRRKRAR